MMIEVDLSHKVESHHYVEGKDYFIFTSDYTSQHPNYIKDIVKDHQTLVFVLLTEEHKSYFLNPPFHIKIINLLFPDYAKSLKLKKLGLFKSSFISLYTNQISFEDFKKYVHNVISSQKNIL
jgi:hypothetical protein